VREFAEAEMRPPVMEWDEAQQFPMDLCRKPAELGLDGRQFPEEYGGAAMSAVDYCICIEELARVCPAIALSVAAHKDCARRTSGCSARRGRSGPICRGW
jgi:alkylation response protein AidB-like acyl-CoA dehydrogenase